MKKLSSNKSTEEWASMHENGRYNPAQVLSYTIGTEKYRHTISAGTSDFIHTFHEGALVYVLSINHRLGYVGLETYENGAENGDVFLQNDNEIAECLGKKGLDLAPMTIAKRLASYIY